MNRQKNCYQELFLFQILEKFRNYTNNLIKQNKTHLIRGTIALVVSLIKIHKNIKTNKDICDKLLLCDSSKTIWDVPKGSKGTLKNLILMHDPFERTRGFFLFLAFDPNITLNTTNLMSGFNSYMKKLESNLGLQNKIDVSCFGTVSNVTRQEKDEVVSLITSITDELTSTIFKYLVNDIIAKITGGGNEPGPGPIGSKGGLPPLNPKFKSLSGVPAPSNA